MRSSLCSLALLSLQALGTIATPWRVYPAEWRHEEDRESVDGQLSRLSHQAQAKTMHELKHGNHGGHYGTGCDHKKLEVRREWGDLSKKERRSYIDAVLCLQSKPALTPASEAPGAKTRFDDFVATHINQSLAIHYTGNFLSWHRYFTWLYEQALRDECGYEGTQPYWDWAKTARTGMRNSPILDGSSTSMSGDGAFVPDRGDVVLGGFGLPEILLPAGPGDGCVTSGPFVNMTVNLGPAQLVAPGNTTIVNPEGVLAYNPRCLKRSLTDEINRAFANASAILDLLTTPDNVYDFQMQMQGVPGSGNIGVHGGGHYAMGGDPGRDVFVSPGDPLFYLHHSNIDRMWWMWQMQDTATRAQGESSVAGTNTFFNQPPSANTTVEDYVQYGYAAGPPRQIKELLKTTEGPFCYTYA